MAPLLTGASREVDRLCGASLRALGGVPDVELHGLRAWRGRQPLPAAAPHLAPFGEHEPLAAFRGAADGLALRLARSDAALHARLGPAEPVPRMLFELLEQLRCESLLPRAMPGLRRNLDERHRAWAEAFHRSGLTETAQGLLLYTVALVCRARISAEPVHEPVEGLIEATRMALAPRLGHALAGLRATRARQAEYAVHARSIAETVAGMLRELPAPRARGGSGRDADRRAQQALFALSFDLEAPAALGRPGTGASRVLQRAGGRYRAFTTAHDREQRAATLVREALRRAYRARLEELVAAQRAWVARLARALQATLAPPQRQGWIDLLEDGLLDGRRLAQLVATPREARLFRREREHRHGGAVVSVLVDCSGSMKAQAEPVATLVDVFARALEQAGAACELLGFTTGAWNGGRALQDWQRAGRPRDPGRLNELCHLVFKDADTPWRRARADIATLLRPELYREGVDGEAVDWACRRLDSRDEARRVLVVISDGCPKDRATELANDDPHYLGQHLRDTVARWEAGGRVAIVGVGVGLDLAPFYRRSVALDLSQGLVPAVWEAVLGGIVGAGVSRSGERR